ncbi:hypothetical protein ACIQXV_08320 [Neobacillus sp. NPDC097160]|uniref:hypothetical protein n=1 Tax=Neobacillus sp. NPDC097160 TaxID=3364298 RepID=UPI0037FBDA5A
MNGAGLLKKENNLKMWNKYKHKYSPLGGFMIEIKFCIGAIGTFIIIGLFKGNFEWDYIFPTLVGGLVGIFIAGLRRTS